MKINQLWKHQQYGIEFSKQHDGFLLNWGMGSGKTIGSIGILEEHQAKRILIITPKSVMQVWQNEINKFSSNFEIQIFNKGTVAKKAQEIRHFLTQTANRNKIVVINYETAWREPLGEIRKNNRIINAGLLREIKWDFIILDEAHKICRASSNVSKFCGRLAESANKRIALTGTPLPNGCLSAYGIFRFLDRSIFGDSDYRFKMRYAMWGGFQGHQVLEYINQDDFKQKFASITHQVKTSEVVELPKVSHIDIDVELSTKAMKLYNEFKNECIIELNSNSILTAENVLVKTLRLAQIASGCVTDELGNEFIIDTSKIDAVTDLIDGIEKDEPIVVFGRFRAEINGLANYLEKQKITYSKLIGGCNQLEEWQQGKTRVLLVNIQSGSLGIDCTRARYNIYISTGYNYANYEQSLARTCRPGADISKKIIYYHVNAVNTIDKAVAYAMKRKENVIDAILGDLGSKNIKFY